MRDRLAKDILPNRPLVHAADGLDIMGIGPRLEIDQKAAFFGSCRLAAGLNRLTSRHIDRNRLGQIDMLARIDGRLSLLGMKIRRRLNHDRIHFGTFQQLLISR